MTDSLRHYFPIFDGKPAPQPWIYFDSAATSQKPQSVIEAVSNFYCQSNANVHRASHAKAQDATSQFELARRKIQKLINAKHDDEIIWTKGGTESINLVASALQHETFEPGSRILISTLEHHANIVPWQQLAISKGLEIDIIPLDEQGEWQTEVACSMITPQTQIVALSHVSNALGNINPIELVIAKAKQVGAVTLIDGAQAVAHLDIDVQVLGCDFYTFSGHKMYGPTGTGVLYGTREWLNRLTPVQFGGEMVKKVSFNHTEFQGLPFKFEAGTPNIAGVIGLSAAIDFLVQHKPRIRQIEHQLYQILIEQLSQLKQVQIYGSVKNSVAIISFTVETLHPQDLGVFLNQHGVALRVGHHCAMPLMQALGLDGTIRVSLGCYNTEQEVYRFVELLKGAISQAQSPEVTAPDNSTQSVLHQPLTTAIRNAKGWEQKYRQIMLAGKQSKPSDKSLQVSENEIFGCESQVWLRCTIQNNKMKLAFYSPSKIVRGLIAIVQETIESCTLAEIDTIDFPLVLDELGVKRYLSESRGNGIQAVIEHIRKRAKEMTNE